jgi:hypothetical protein
MLRISSIHGSAASPLRRLAAVITITAFLGAHLAAFALYLVGDSLRHPVQYFFTWDMFPHHYSESVRRVAVGRTLSGRLVRLHPSLGQAFRAGVHQDMTRVDLDRRGVYFRAVVEQTRRAAAPRHRDDPIVRVFLFERYWPVKYNFNDAHYQDWTGQPKPWLNDPLAAPGQTPARDAWPPQRAYWRLREEYAVPEPNAGNSS